jgi:hypothetical protein
MMQKVIMMQKVNMMQKSDHAALRLPHHVGAGGEESSS